MRAAFFASIVAVLLACAGSSTSPRDATVSDIARVDAATDAGPDCVALCTSAAAACMYLDATMCESACMAGSVTGMTSDGGTDTVTQDVRACLDAAGSMCSAARACLRPPPTTPFVTGTYGYYPRSLAGPFTLPTSDGDWDFQSEWTGTDHYIFVVYDPGALSLGSADYSTALFQGSLQDLLAVSPANVHYIFMWQNDETGFNAIRDGWLAEFAGLSADYIAQWRPRVHFVTTQAKLLPGWVGDNVTFRFNTAMPYKEFDPLQWAIDSTQHVREVGQLGTLTNDGIATDITYLANLPVYFDFEMARQSNLDAESAMVIPLTTEQTAHDTIDLDITLPDATTMASFDTMEIDQTIECPHHRDGECGAWDYLSYLWVCELAPPPDAGVTDGGSADGGVTDASMDGATDAAITDGGAVDATDAGPAYACNTELARWITTYWAEGRWVTDISGMLPYLRAGGHQHLRWYASPQFDPRSTDYIVSLSLRLVHGNRTVRPVQVQSLWTGGNLNATYDSMHPPIHFTVPAGTTHVELQTLLTGHGGVAPYDCAEFCDHQHHFTVNGHAYTEDFPGAQTATGCEDRVDAGVVPNQMGTWYFGRGGWCPGGDVAPWIQDITGDIVPGDNVITYTTTFHGLAVTGNLGNIVLTSNLVFSQ